MKLTRIAKLLPDDELRTRLLDRIQLLNSAAIWLAEISFVERTWARVALHHRAYRELRERFNLQATEAYAVLGKVVAAYANKKRRTKLATFRSLSSIPLIQHRYLRTGEVSLYGFHIPFVCDTELSSKHEARLVIQGGKLLLYQTIEVEETSIFQPTDWLGVDLGIVNLAVDSDGKVYSGKQTNGLRRRHKRLRAKLQSKGTRSAKRLLQKRSGKERRFAANVNHIISKGIVTEAHGSGRGIALENLKGIRSRIKATRAQRGRLHSWGFAQLRSFIEYKARLKGVAVVTINPAYTSQTCPNCGLIDKRNRKTRNDFQCVGCGFAGPADAIAAENIRRAVGNRPDATAASG